MTIHAADIWLQADAIIALVSVIVIGSYQRNNSRHKLHFSFIAWLAMIALISIPIRIWARVNSAGISKNEWN